MFSDASPGQRGPRADAASCRTGFAILPLLIWVAPCSMPPAWGAVGIYLFSDTQWLFPQVCQGVCGWPSKETLAFCARRWAGCFRKLFNFVFIATRKGDTMFRFRDEEMEAQQRCQSLKVRHSQVALFNCGPVSVHLMRGAPSSSPPCWLLGWCQVVAAHEWEQGPGDKAALGMAVLPVLWLLSLVPFLFWGRLG